MIILKWKSVSSMSFDHQQMEDQDSQHDFKKFRSDSCFLPSLHSGQTEPSQYFRYSRHNPIPAFAETGPSLCNTLSPSRELLYQANAYSSFICPHRYLLYKSSLEATKLSYASLPKFPLQPVLIPSEHL